MFCDDLDQVVGIDAGFVNHPMCIQVFTAALQKHHTENEQFREQVEQIYAQQAKAYVDTGAA